MRLAIITLIILLCFVLCIATVYGETTVTNNSLNDKVFSSVDITSLRIENISETIHYGGYPTNSGNPTIANISFSVSGEPSLITYSLDNQANITITGNFTITNPTFGNHNLTVYAIDQTGNTAQQTFNLKVPEPTISYGIAFYIAPLFAIIAIAVSLVVYFGRIRKRIGKSTLLVKTIYHLYLLFNLNKYEVMDSYVKTV